jgi:hypothetical protein
MSRSFVHLNEALTGIFPSWLTSTNTARCFLAADYVCWTVYNTISAMLLLGSGQGLAVDLVDADVPSIVNTDL